jgi:hypothetical protein
VVATTITTAPPLFHRRHRHHITAIAPSCRHQAATAIVITTPLPSSHHRHRHHDASPSTSSQHHRNIVTVNIAVVVCETLFPTPTMGLRSSHYEHKTLISV